MIRYSLRLPLQHRTFDAHPTGDTDLTFTINHIKSRRPSILYYILHCYNITCAKVVDEETGEVSYTGEILIDDKPVYTSERTVIGTVYGDEPSYTDTFTIPKKTVENTVYVQVEICTLGIDSENPLYFNELMLQEGTEFNGYHDPQEMEKMNSHVIKVPSLYANLYDFDGNYLQVIRPNGESFNTNNLSKAQYTILAPHFEDEMEVDNHISVFLEAMNQTEQRIDILR